MRIVAALTSILIVAACVSTTPAPTLDNFERALAANDSATAALRDWCAAEALDEPATITADHLDSGTQPPTHAIRDMLEVGPQEQVGYRHVQLKCGATILSIAHNWYVPARLTPAMNATLDTSDVPFGRAVAALNFTRQRLEAVRGADPACPADTILSHRALLRRADGQPISMVIECYTPANLSGRTVVNR